VVGVVVVFFVTFVDVLANDDVDLAVGVVALDFVWAGVGDDVDADVAVAVVGFLVKSTFSAFGGAGVAVTGFLLATEAFLVADVAVADVFLSDMLEIDWNGSKRNYSK
jgi:hypothetical protein